MCCDHPPCQTVRTPLAHSHQCTDTCIYLTSTQADATAQTVTLHINPGTNPGTLCAQRQSILLILYVISCCIHVRSRRRVGQADSPIASAAGPAGDRRAAPVPAPTRSLPNEQCLLQEICACSYPLEQQGGEQRWTLPPVPVARDQLTRPLSVMCLMKRARLSCCTSSHVLATCESFITHQAHMDAAGALAHVQEH